MFVIEHTIKNWFYFEPVIINSMCQFDHAMGNPDIWPNIILDIFIWECFKFKSIDQVTQIVLHKV